MTYPHLAEHKPAHSSNDAKKDEWKPHKYLEKVGPSAKLNVQAAATTFEQEITEETEKFSLFSPSTLRIHSRSSS